MLHIELLRADPAVRDPHTHLLLDRIAHLIGAIHTGQSGRTRTARGGVLGNIQKGRGRGGCCGCSSCGSLRALNISWDHQ